MFQYLTRHMLIYQQAGLTCFERPFTEEEIVAGEVEKLNLENFGLAFIILFSGVIMSAVTLFTEKVCRNCCKNN